MCLTCLLMDLMLSVNISDLVYSVVLVSLTLVYRLALFVAYLAHITASTVGATAFWVLSCRLSISISTFDA